MESSPTQLRSGSHRPSDVPLSADVECLKWQAYLALRNATSPPSSTQTPTTFLAAHLIPQWADQQAQPEPDYVSLEAHDESRAWVALLEGTVHAALLASQPTPSYLESLLSMRPVPPAPINALLLPAFGAHISYDAIYVRYKDAVAALSDRLSTDKWFLASPEPTPLDAIVVSSNTTLRIEVMRRVNLVAWGWRVREQSKGFGAPPGDEDALLIIRAQLKYSTETKRKLSKPTDSASSDE
ncbi:hypothetical protein DXG01_016406 [Tephrocybe rancida]|nr:hypothetical protein DXG01_016406 [Tephrocybe rancida]